MKSATDIRNDFDGTTTVTRGERGNSGEVWTCDVSGGPLRAPIRGLGSSIFHAEDAAWHGVLITLRED